MSLIPILTFHTEDTDRVRYTMNIFLLPGFYLSASHKFVLVARLWYTVMDSIILATYANITSPVQHQKVAPIVGYEASKSVLEQWAVFITVLWVTTSKTAQFISS